ALGGFLLLVSLISPWFLPFLAVYFMANLYLAKGRWWAPLILALMASGSAVYLDHSYLEAVARFNARVAAGNRYLALACLGFVGLYSAAFIVSIIYSRMAPRPARELGRCRWLALKLKLLYAGMTRRATCYYGLGVACSLIALSPALIVLGDLVLYPLQIRWLRRASDWPEEFGWLGLMTFGFVIGSLHLFTRAKRWASLPLATARAIDFRHPILLLRSFQDDITPITRTTDSYASIRGLIVPTMWTLEETIERALAPHGPLIAIGRPGEPIPPAGAAREYVSNDGWRARITDYIHEARLVVVILGKTEGLEFEYRALMDLGALEKLVVVFPPVDVADAADRWNRFRQVTKLTSETSLAWKATRALAAFFTENGTLCVATCRWADDEDCYRLALDRCLVEKLKYSGKKTF
ncbi:MAG: hypothetical protein L0Z50_24530, partial [Verrucomicrobiales bacterium]|nr:hypothetical protein [Verrucomicrobiales bacterium]